MIAARLAIDHAAALPHLQRALAYDVHGGAPNLADLAANEAVFELVEAGQVVGAFTLGVHEYSDGRVMRCGAAGGRPGHDLVGAMVGFAEGEARRIGARTMVCETRRRGLVRRLQRAGFKVAGFILTKAL